MQARYQRASAISGDALNMYLLQPGRLLEYEKSMRLTKQTSHAIRILIDCARAGSGLVKVSDVAARLDITKQNAFKIVHLLAKSGFLASVRGPHGGIRLARPALHIRVSDVVRAMEQTSFGGEPGSDRAPAKAAAPSLGTVFGDAMDAFIAVLDAHTLADLAAAHRAEPARPKPAVKAQGKRRASAKKA